MSILNPFEGEKKGKKDGPIQQVPPMKDDSGLDKPGDGFDINLSDDDSTGKTKPMPKPTTSPSKEEGSKENSKPDPKPDSKEDSKEEGDNSKGKSPKEKNPEPKEGSKGKPEKEPEPDPKPKEDPEPDPEPKPKTKPKAKLEPKPMPKPEDVGFMPGVYFTPEQLAAIERHRALLGLEISEEVASEFAAGGYEEDLAEYRAEQKVLEDELAFLRVKERERRAKLEAAKWRPEPILNIEDGDEFATKIYETMAAVIDSSGQPEIKKIKGRLNRELLNRFETVQGQKFLRSLMKTVLYILATTVEDVWLAGEMGTAVLDACLEMAEIRAFYWDEGDKKNPQNGTLKKYESADPDFVAQKKGEWRQCYSSELEQFVEEAAATSED